MKCSKCGQEGYSLVLFVNISTMKRDYICSRCQAIDTAQSISDLDELDKYIVELEDMAQKLEEMIKEFPEMPEVPEGLEGIAHTPLSNYKDINIALTELKSRKLELLTQKGSQAMLEYELKKALEAEDYKKSAAIHEQLEKLKKK